MPRRTLLISLLGCLALAATGTARTAQAAESDADAVAAAVQDYVEGFNSKDADAWAKTMIFPHVVFSDGQVVVYGSRDDALEAIDIPTFAETTGWRRSEIDSREVLQVSRNKAHVATRISRFGEDDTAYSTFDGLFIVEKHQEKWGVRAYSRLALERPGDW